MLRRVIELYVLCVVCFGIFIFSMGCDSSSDDLLKGEIVKGEIAKKLDTYLKRITPFGFSGAILVAEDDEVILNKGYGLAIRSEDISNTSDTVFSTGSITKQFTAAGIMKLEMMGKLNTGDLISKYFDGVPEDKKDITLHHLLTHTSGVIDSVGGDYEKALRDETVQKILDEPLLLNPGEEFSYSNAGYSLLAGIIEKVSGQSYEEFMRSHIFKPVGMGFTGYRMPDWGKKVVAHWYAGEKDNGTPLERSYPYWNLLGNGGILSTTMDMYRWHRALLGDKVLSNEAKAKIFTPYLNDYGYGWDVLEAEMGTLIQHDGGSTLGNSAEMRRYLDAGIVTMLFCNQSYGRGFLFEVVRDKIEALVFGGGVELPPVAKTIDPEALERYQGEYRLASGGEFTVSRESGKLLVGLNGQDAVNAMFSVAKEDAEMFEQVNGLSEKIFVSALRGDFEEFGKVLYDRDRMLGFFREDFKMILERHKKRTGEIKGAFFIVTLPFDLAKKKSYQTFVDVKGKRGSLYFDLIWRDSKIVGFGVDMRAPALSVPFLALTSEGIKFAGYHLDMARNFQINFLVDKNGQVTGLTVPNEDGPIVALKSK